MIKEEKFNNAKPVDFFNELTKEEKEEAELKANIAMAIHNKRIEMNMLQQDFADMNHVSQTMVSKWESGDYNFTISNLRKILSTMGMEIVLQEKEKSKPIHASHTNNTTEWKTASSGGGTAFAAYNVAASPSAV